MRTLVFSLNPAVDVEWRVPAVLPEEKNELRSETRWPGGKGINVARWLAWLGHPSRLFLPLGGATGRELAAGLRTEALRATVFPIQGTTRANVVLTPDRGPQFRFNPTWPRLTPGEAGRLGRAACVQATQAKIVVISGTMAFGAPASLYARMVSAARGAGARVYLDCDREPFALAAREGPFLVKPNAFELSQWAGRKLRGEADLVKSARKLSAMTGGWVLVSRGPEGALLVHAQRTHVVKAHVPKVVARNSVGAGDALLAGVIAAVETGSDPEEWLARGVATGTSATQVGPGNLPSRRVWQQIRREVNLC